MLTVLNIRKYKIKKIHGQNRTDFISLILSITHYTVMNRKLKRRTFIGRLSAAALSGVLLSSCSEAGNSKKEDGPGFDEELAKNRQMPKDLVLKMLDQKVNQHMQRSHHCAQSSFMALKEQFGLEGDQVIKALTPLPGIAERGETCGAVTGPLMALGLIYGRDEQHMDDWDKYQESLVPAGRYFDRFEKEFGTTTCHGVQEVKFGKCYHLTDPAELQEFQNAGATDHCSEVVRSAVRMAAEIILEDKSL
jgi:C_GCAxxG_C_C family probable redox protein